jgi:exonuclease VII large subunit
MATSPTQTTQQTLTVSQLTAQIKDALEGEFPSVWAKYRTTRGRSQVTVTSL